VLVYKCLPSVSTKLPRRGVQTGLRLSVEIIPVQQCIATSLHYEIILTKKFHCFSSDQCLHQAAPTYLAELCLPVPGSANRDHLRLAAPGDLAVPRSRTTRYGQRCFAVFGPTLWNSLPLSVLDPSLTLTQFYTLLKTALFC